MPIVTPRRMTNNDVSNTPELSGGPQLVPSRISVVLVEETNVGDTSGRECPCDDQEKRPLAGMSRQVGLCLMTTFGRCVGGGHCPLPMWPGDYFRLMLRMHQRFL